MVMVEQNKNHDYPYMDQLRTAVEQDRIDARGRYKMRDEQGVTEKKTPPDSYEAKYYLKEKPSAPQNQPNLPGIDVEPVQSGSEQRVA